MLRDVTFRLQEKQTYIIQGASGSGKTTLLRLIAALEKADSGTVSVGGPVSYAFQETRLFPHLTIRENIAAIVPRLEPDKILRELNISDSMDKYPHELSGGMRKRAELARAVAAEAEIYLLDEPTAGLDAMHAEMVADTILKHTADKIVLISTHDHDFASKFSARRIDVANAAVTVTE